MIIITLSIFVFLFLFFIFIFVIYPFLFLAIAFIFGKKKKPVYTGFLPTVSIIICAKDEEAYIEEKIKNLLELDYEINKREIIIVSDGSTDNTNSIIRQYEGQVKPIILTSNVGKTEAQNFAVKECRGEILVFSDANSFIQKDALKKMIRHFEDGKTAGVSGCLLYYKKGASRNMEAQYNNLDIKIKKGESALNAVFGSFGTLYAIRKSCYIPLPPYIISDFVEPVLQLINDYNNVFEAEAYSYEEVNKSLKTEMKRKSRIILRSMIGYFFLIKNGLMKKPLLFIHSLFRKFFRWLLPLYLILGAISIWVFFLFFRLSLFIGFNVSIVVFVFITVFSFLISNKGGRNNPVLNLFFYFYILNASTIIALIKLIKGEKISSWKPRQ